jgi:transient receptor potential cation channel subfamily A protein 1
MPKVAEEVFRRCTVSESSTDGSMSQDNYVYFNYEFLEDFRDPPRRTIRSTVQDYGTYALTSDLGETNDLKSTSATKLDDTHADMVTKLRFRSKHSFSTSWGPIGFKKSRHPLSIMVAAERTELLKHPLAVSLLMYKWETYGRYIYYSNLLIYVIFLGLLTTFALLVPHPETETCRAVSSGNFGVNITNNTSLLTSEQRNIQEGSCDSVINFARHRALLTMSVFVILFSLIRLLMEVFQAFQLRLVHYFLSWVNWIELLVFSSSILFVMTFLSDCLCPTIWQWQVGAIAIFLGWVDLIVFIRKLPGTGIYVVMFVDIFYTFWRLFFLSLLLVIAFGLAFYMAFYEPDVGFRRTPFSTPARSLLKTITMTTGEFEFDTIFRQSPEVNTEEEIPYPPISYLLWIAFIILMPILLTNLLVGLAVDDIKGILEAAVLKRLALQVELAVNVEELFPRRIRRWLMIGSRRVRLNRQLGVLERARAALSGKERFDSSDNIARALKPALTPIEQVQAQNHRLLSEMDQMKQSLASLRETVATLVSYRGGFPVSRAGTPQPPKTPEPGATAPELGDLSLQDVVSHI